MKDEEENIEIRELLRKLPSVKAGEGFLEKLSMKISVIESDNIKSDIRTDRSDNKSFGVNRSAWLYPALGLSAAVIFVFYITFLNKDEIINNTSSSNKTQETQETQAPNDTPDKKSPYNVSPSPSSVPEISDNEKGLNQRSEEDLSVGNQNKINERFKDQGGKVEKNIQTEEPAPATTTTYPEGLLKENSQTDEKKEDFNNNGNNMPEKSRIFNNENKTDDDKSKKSPGENTEEFEKPIKKSLRDKLDAMNKKNLEKLKKKVNE